MKRSTLLLFVSALVLLTFLLKVISFHIAFRIGPIGVLSIEAWVAVLFVATLITVPRIYGTRAMAWGITYALIVWLMKQSGHLVSSASVWLDAQVFPLMLTILLNEMYRHKSLMAEYRKIIFIALVMIGISLILNINGLIRYPLAVRFITGAGASDSAIELFRSRGIEGYGFFSGLPPLIPVCVYQFKNSVSKVRRLLWGLFIAAIITAVVLSTITTPILLAFIALALSALGSVVLRKGYSLVILSIIVVLFIVITPEQIGMKFIDGMMAISPSKPVDDRLQDIKHTLSGEFDVTSTSSGSNLSTVESRFQRVYWNLEVFSKHPFLGSSRDNDSESFHLFWLYALASLGFVGTIPMIMALFTLIAGYYKRVSPEFRFYYSLSILIFIAMGLAKNVTGWFMYIVPLFIAPGVYWVGQKEIPAKDADRIPKMIR